MSKIENMWQKVVNKLSDEEIIVANATSTKVAWGPTTEEMDEIIQLSRSEAQEKILQFIFAELADSHADWRVVYKTLLLVEYMSLHADMGVVDYFKRNIEDIRRLQGYEFRDKEGTDKGINIRKRAETVADELDDVDLPEKRKEAQEEKGKYTQAIGSGFSGNYSGNTGSYEASNYQGGYQANRDDLIEESKSNLGGFAQVQPETNQLEQQPIMQPELQPIEYEQAAPTQYEPEVEELNYPAHMAMQPPQPEYEIEEPEISAEKPVAQFAPPPVQQLEETIPQSEFEPVQQAPKEEDLLADIFGATAPESNPQSFAQPTFSPAAQPAFSPVNQQLQYVPPAEEAPYQSAPVAAKKKDDIASLLDF